MTGQRERRGVFGEAVDQYETARPGYPAEVVADILAFAGPGPVLEVGAGTGKASVGFAAHGVDLTCVEPDPRMAEVLAGHCPAARVEVSSFEAWRPDRGYALLYSATAWHWVDPATRWDLAHAALAPGGALALFWHSFAIADPDAHAALIGVDHRHGLDVDHTPHSWTADRLAGEITDQLTEVWPTVQLADDPRFTDLESRRYRVTHRYDTDRYLDLLASISAYRMLAPDVLDAVLTDVAAVVDARGGTLEMLVATDLALGRRTPTA
ncbi:class I SAM-dependent methyltransferase [Longispora sp. K20-0274]|uniref:class I SAM-dependent methyltransferase n=1 Tax=Longispora sp. K20-0274 TaxID=3088255 RepID=UPI00399A47CD